MRRFDGAQWKPTDTKSPKSNCFGIGADQDGLDALSALWVIQYSGPAGALTANTMGTHRQLDLSGHWVICRGRPLVPIMPILPEGEYLSTKIEQTNNLLNLFVNLFQARITPTTFSIRKCYISRNGIQNRGYGFEPFRRWPSRRWSRSTSASPSPWRRS